MDDYAGMTVEEILRLKRAAILRARLPKGSPSWDDILHLTWEEIVDKQKRREKGPGSKTPLRGWRILWDRIPILSLPDRIGILSHKMRATQI